MGCVVRPGCRPIMDMLRCSIFRPVSVKCGVFSVNLVRVNLFTTVRRRIPTIKGVAVTGGGRQSSELAGRIGGGGCRDYCAAVGIEGYRIRIGGNIYRSRSKGHRYGDAVKIGKIRRLVVCQAHGYGGRSAANHRKFQGEQNACRVHVIFYVIPLHILPVCAAAERTGGKYGPFGDCFQLQYVFLIGNFKQRSRNARIGCKRNRDLDGFSNFCAGASCLDCGRFISQRRHRHQCQRQAERQ